MVTGLNVFRDYFAYDTDKYVLIGGAACDIVFTSNDATFRATKDLDMVLIVEALSPEFGEKFWKFIDQRFIWVDTETKQWGFADGNGEPEKLPDPKMDIRNYTVGDYVKFKIRYHGSDIDEILDGTVEIIDHYPGGHSSIDVMSGDTLYKHLTLDDVLEYNKEG